MKRRKSELRIDDCRVKEELYPVTLFGGSNLKDFKYGLQIRKKLVGFKIIINQTNEHHNTENTTLFLL